MKLFVTICLATFLMAFACDKTKKSEKSPVTVEKTANGDSSTEDKEGVNLTEDQMKAKEVVKNTSASEEEKAVTDKTDEVKTVTEHPPIFNADRTNLQLIPAAVGNTWNYKQELTTTSVSRTTNYSVTVKSYDGKVITFSTGDELFVEDGKYYRLDQMRGGMKTKSLVYFKPLNDLETYRTTIGGDAMVTGKVTKLKQDVVTPAGTFSNCLYFDLGGDEYVTIAPGAGIVKREYGRKGSTYYLEAILQSYKIGDE